MLVVKNLPANTGNIRDTGSIPGSGRSTGGGHGNPPQYSCLEHPIDRGAWRARIHRVTKSRTWLKQFSTHEYMQSVFSYTPSRASTVIKGRTGDFLKAWRPPTPGSLEDHVSVTASPSLNGTEKTLPGCWADWRIPGGVALLWGWWCLPLVLLLLPFLHEQFPHVSPVWSVH